MRLLIGTIAIFAMLHGQALACRDRDGATQAAPAKQSPATKSPANVALLDQAAALERAGKGPEAVKVYVRAARSGSGPAAQRLGEIYDKGIAGVARNQTESQKWYNAARVMGEDVPMSKCR